MRIKGKAWGLRPQRQHRPHLSPRSGSGRPTSLGEMASHLMVGIDEGFPGKIAPRRYHRRRAELRFCGSSREEAAAAMKEGGRSSGRGAELRAAVYPQTPSMSDCQFVTSPPHR